MSSERLLVQRLIELLRADPEGWSVSKYSVRHSSGLAVWRGNGWSFCEPWDPDISIGLLSRWRLWRAVQEIVHMRTLRRLEGALQGVGVGEGGDGRG